MVMADSTLHARWCSLLSCVHYWKRESCVIKPIKSRRIVKRCVAETSSHPSPANSCCREAGSDWTRSEMFNDDASTWKAARTSTAVQGHYVARHINSRVHKKLSYRRGTARCVVSVEILPTVTEQCRNYLYDKSWTKYQLSLIDPCDKIVP